MTLLNDQQITERVESGWLGIAPFDYDAVQPASVDVTLGTMFKQFAGDPVIAIDPEDPEIMETTYCKEGESFDLVPGGFLLGHTVEQVTLPADIAARFEGKSTLGRLGLMTHITAGFIDPGFQGQITVEIHNVSGRYITLRPGMFIGQLCFFRMTYPAQRPYGHRRLGSKYHGQMGATGAR